MSAGYDEIAEFYDLVARRQTASSGPALAAIVRALPSYPAPIVEIGAGTGRVTRTLVRARPDLDVLAIEPSPSMRAILTSRVWADPAMRDRVTVVPGSVPAVSLPERILAAVVFGVAGHLGEDERRVLFDELRRRLVPGGVVVVELMGAVRELAPTRTLTERVGDLDYEWWVSGRPIGPSEMAFANVWRVLRSGRTIREVVDEHRWTVLTAEQLAAESGMRVRTVAHGDGERIAVLTPE